MILYDKSGLFLGMGTQELYLLGYEDMEEFRNYHNDVADLFVNKPGYIFKFKNFSWIEYVLHSGTPNRHVIVKTKNGKEIETSLDINEIFLQKEINGSSLFFGIEFTNAPFRHDLPTTSVSPVPSSTQEIEEAQSPIFNEESLIEDAPSSFSSDIDFKNDIPFATSSADTDYTPPLFTKAESLEEDYPTPMISIPMDEPQAETEVAPDFKLKFDHTILEEPKIQDSASENAPCEYDSIDQIKLDDLAFDTQLETYPEDKQEDLLSDSTLFVDKIKEDQTTQEEEFDLALCAEELGLDISTLAQIIEEYIESLNTAMPILTQAINTNNRNSAKIEIIKLKSIALHLHITSLYHRFDHLETGLEFDTKEEILQTLENLNQAVLEFKENIL